MEPLKKQFLELLDKDLEFRYAVAGYLGLSEVLKRLDSLAEEQARLREGQVKIWEEIKALREEQVRLREEQAKTWVEIAKVWEEIKALREGQVKIWSEIARIWGEIRGLREEQAKLAEEQKRLAEEQVGLREEQAKLWREMGKLREDMIKGFERHDAELAELRRDLNNLREDFNRAFKLIDARLSRVEKTLEKLTLEIEDEARIIVKHRLKEMGYEVEVAPLILPEAELNIYGVSGDLCIVGEASVRASSRAIDEVDWKIERLRKLYPDKLRPKVIKVIYTSLAMPDLVERAGKEGVWVLKATEDVVKPRL
ncbi:MAG: hypothetical protein N3H31_06535 [Candidatus Nezhaarchaeota archaeon]|nr:hypothetical protein [Candidatus Nezhaarchaeota archaeon]